MTMVMNQIPIKEYPEVQASHSNVPSSISQDEQPVGHETQLGASSDYLTMPDGQVTESQVFADLHEQY